MSSVRLPVFQAWGVRYQILAALHELGVAVGDYTIEVRAADAEDAGVHVDGRRIGGRSRETR